MASGNQMRLTDKELEIIKNTFRDNDDLLKLLRKVFLPEYDPEAPLGQVIDLWMTVNVREEKDNEKIIRNILARNELIFHVEQRLQELSLLANSTSMTLDEKKERAKKDSTK